MPKKGEAVKLDSEEDNFKLQWLMILSLFGC